MSAPGGGPGFAGALLVLSGGAFVGILLAVFAWLGAFLVTNPAASGDAAVDALFANAEPVSTSLGSFAFWGGFLGALVAGVVGGVRMVRRGLRAVGGAFLGASAGLLIYAAGYVTANYPEAIGRPEYPLLYVEAFYSFTAVEFFCIVLGGLVGWSVVRYEWRYYGLLTYVALLAVVSGYLTYALGVTLPQVPASAMPISLVLFLAEAGSLLMVVVYTFYAVDVSVRTRWRRTHDRARFSRYYLPKVAFHVGVYNEPPAMVAETLQSPLALDYPKDRYLVMVLDDSTDETLRRPIEEFCRAHGVSYIHRRDRRGYKAGALNEGLRQTPADVDFIAVIDADYQVRPEYLRETVGYFIDPRVGFVQTPQDYRNIHQSFLTEQYFYADSYFYRAVLPSRNEENAIIFCGTMGIVRRKVLEEIGGWGEAYVAEDAELSFRVLERGYESLYINRSYGHGLIPATFEAYKKQHYRWAFGGIQILKGHFRKFLWSRLSARQKFDFLVGSVHWFDGIFVVGISSILLVIAAGDLLGFGVVTYDQREIWLLGLVPLFLLVDGVTRLHMALRRSMDLSFLGTLRVLGMWFSIKFNNMMAAFKALFGYRIAFVRTPKAPDERIGSREAIARSVDLTKFESTMAVVLLAFSVGVAWNTGIVGRLDGGLDPTRVLLLLWLVYYSLIFLAAPVYAYKAYVTFTPERPPAPVPRPVRG
ncbi:MAG: glycosyltransferase [Methanobacteriota archaeon]